MYFQFYLAFENSLCLDYITEKFWKVLDYNCIPVVFNGVNMSSLAPKHSYIDLKDFNTIEGCIVVWIKIKKIAKWLFRGCNVPLESSWRRRTIFLLLLVERLLFSRTEPQKSKSFNYLHTFSVSNECSPQAWCSLCASLHDAAAPASTVPDLSQWWVHEAQCQHLGERTYKLLWEIQKWMAG